MNIDGSTSSRAVVRPPGRIDVVSAHAFADSLVHAAQSADAVVVDLSAVPAITGAGFAAMVEALTRVLESCRCSIVSIQPRVRRMFLLAGLQHVVELERENAPTGSSDGQPDLIPHAP